MIKCAKNLEGGAGAKRGKRRMGGTAQIIMESQTIHSLVHNIGPSRPEEKFFNILVTKKGALRLTSQVLSRSSLGTRTEGLSQRDHRQHALHQLKDGYQTGNISSLVKSTYYHYAYESHPIPAS